MLSRKSIGFMGAVWLGIVALLMPPIANAVIDLDADDKSMAAVTYAKETLTTTTAVKGKDRATYYTASGGTSADGNEGFLAMQAAAGIAVDGDYVR